MAIGEREGEACLCICKGKGRVSLEPLQMFNAWQEQAARLSAGEISREEYGRWRYHYPKFDTTGHWAKIPSKEQSDTLTRAFKKRLKDI